MKKVSYIASMLLVALSTAGAMVVGQSFAAQSDKAPCADTSKAQAHSDQSPELPSFFYERAD